MKTIITFILVLFLFGFNITFKNDTDVLSCYWLFWIDHNFEGHTKPANMVGGELKPGKSKDVNQGYPHGEWAIRWSGCRSGDWETTRKLPITEDDTYVLTTPSGDLIQ